MSKTFCQICRHPSDVPPGHDANCPVYTGDPQRGINPQQGINPQDMQPLNLIQQNGLMGSFSVICPHCGGLNGMHQWAGSGLCPGMSTHWSAYGSDLRIPALEARVARLEEEVARLERLLCGKSIS